jgi:hypothetical protein
VTWNNAFPTTSYHVQVGAVTITDGSGPVSVVADSTTFTLTGCTLLASGAFTGTVSVLAWQNGANPYADLHPSDLSKLQFTIATWRPNALCVGVYAVAQGTMSVIQPQLRRLRRLLGLMSYPPSLLFKTPTATRPPISIRRGKSFATSSAT